ncbi:nitrogen fixation protein NifU [Streptomyces albidus (ex Kaewkla and Franco 2022)]|uniref:nitrogen fixation protein NifU n=1 Tax=Streptomyces albidus (ex Kaewkla and Franco 2022) TaxID=722709 RepID=UPI0015EF190F|nr:nitrogen fixation protein NifU [Streptomyces albidus (ex Kaewkla and Franco 2022)]
MSWDESEAREHVARTEKLLSGLDGLADTRAREHAMDALHAMAELYGECLARVMHHADGPVTAAIASDELVSHLLLVHDLHPDPVEQRVRRALEDVRGVTVLEVRQPEARIAVSPQGCGGPPEEQLTQTVRDAVAWAAPEIEKVEIERAETAQTTLISVDSLFRGPQPAGNR